MRMKQGLYFLILLLVPVLGFCQVEKTFSLDEIILLAQSESPEVKLAEMRKSNAYWTNKSFLGNYKPEINLDLTLPSLNRSIIPIDLPDGTQVFRERSQMVNDISISLQQNITATGGSVFASTGLQRLDNFIFNQNEPPINYLSNPIDFGFNQPIFGFNELKWDKRIMPMVYKESKAKFSEDLEAVSQRAVSQFFSLINAQMNLESAKARKVIADDLYELGENRYSVGNIAETDLLQLELDVMSANTDISNASVQQQTANERLRNFLGINEDIKFILDLPLIIPDIEIGLDKALTYARANRSKVLELQRQMLEAERNVEQTKANSGISGNLTGSIGVTGFGENLNKAYGGLSDREVVTLRLSIPIADWGKSKARYEIAKSNYDLINLNTQNERINFENEVKIAVQQFELVKQNVAVAKRSYEISQKRYDLTKKRYKIGKVDITQLNLADREQESQRKSYIQAITQFWEKYYEIRSLTLYDFINEESLVRKDNE